MNIFGSEELFNELKKRSTMAHQNPYLGPLTKPGKQQTVLSSLEPPDNFADFLTEPEVLDTKCGLNLIKVDGKLQWVDPNDKKFEWAIPKGFQTETSSAPLQAPGMMNFLINGRRVGVSQNDILKAEQFKRDLGG